MRLHSKNEISFWSFEKSLISFSFYSFCDIKVDLININQILQNRKWFNFDHEVGRIIIVNVIELFMIQYFAKNSKTLNTHAFCNV